MPNQLAKFRRRTSLAEHEAVLAALAELARGEDVTVADLFREGARERIAREAQNKAVANRLREVVLAHAPSPPKSFQSGAQVARFNREQREFDELVQRLGLADASEIQDRNSLVPQGTRIRLIGDR